MKGRSSFVNLPIDYRNQEVLERLFKILGECNLPQEMVN